VKHEMQWVIAGALACAACGGQMKECDAPGAAPPTPPPATAAPPSPAPTAAAVPAPSTTVAATAALAPADGTFGNDVTFLKAYADLVLLGDPEAGAAVAVSPEYQGRVMTSSARGAAGKSFGFINREVVAGRSRQPHITVFGGEDRFWLGPEGGQYGLYFPPGAPYDFEHWQVPEAIDWGAWPAVERTATAVRFQKDMVLVNHAGTTFHLRVERRVRLLPPADVAAHLGAPLPAGAAAVGYESENTITNTGIEPWSKKTGLPSIWILGMYRPSPTTTVVLPFRAGPEAQLGKIVNDAYFGKIPPDRLRTLRDVLLFSGDGNQRGKIGIPRPRARPIAGSFDAEGNVLTLVEYDLPAPAPYVNSMWEEQKDPFDGDVLNSYNDGSPGPGKKPLGPFYEIESSSPGAALAPGKSLKHVHRTLHVEGATELIGPIAKRKLGVTLAEITNPAPK
jgi:hypothetical protein